MRAHYRARRIRKRRSAWHHSRGAPRSVMAHTRIGWSNELHASIAALRADAKGALARRWLERALFELAPEAFRAAGLVDDAKRFATLECSLAAAPQTVRILEELRDCVQQSPLWE